MSSFAEISAYLIIIIIIIIIIIVNKILSDKVSRSPSAVGVLTWLYVWSEVQIVCLWSS